MKHQVGGRMALKMQHRAPHMEISTLKKHTEIYKRLYLMKILLLNCQK